MSKSVPRNNNNIQLPSIPQQQLTQRRQIKCSLDQAVPTTAACLTCNHLLCVSCVISHSKTSPNHEVLDIREAYKKLREGAKVMEVRLRQIGSRIKQQPHGNVVAKIDGKIFNESLETLKKLRQQIEEAISKHFDRLIMSFAQLWDCYIETWGQGGALQERLSILSAKLTSFINNEQANESTLSDYFSEWVMLDCERLINSWERKLKNNTSEFLIPPRLVYDLSQITKLETELSQLVQVFDWSFQDKEGVLQITEKPYIQTNTLSLFPMHCPFMYSYNLETREYQVGEFEAPENYLPYYIKTVFIENGDVLFVGGADKSGMPVKTNILFSSNEGTLSLKESLPRSKNPGNGLIYLPETNEIYVIGGMRVEDEKHTWTRSCEVYNLKENSWKSIADMKQRKPYQSIWRRNDHIYAIGMPTDNSNIERLDIKNNVWEQIELQRNSLNPYIIGGTGFSAIQVNEKQVLLFGGKSWSKNSIEGNNILFDEEVVRQVYLFDCDLNHFSSVGEKFTGTGVNYGEYNPIIFDNKIIFFEGLVSKVKKLHRWYSIIQCVEISVDQSGQWDIKTNQIMTPE